MKSRLWMKRIVALSSAGVLSALSSTAGAFGMMEVGDWEVEFSGNVNAFLTQVECEADANGGVVAGGLACGSNGSTRDVGNIRTGLLPSWFGFHAQRTTEDLKYGVTLSFQPGIDSNTPIAGAPIDGGLGLNSSNFRQIFLDFGSDDWGTFKFGRDLGLFGSDAILSDMTLLGVGTVSDLTEGGGNTSLGRIGVGYVYADWKAQFQYTSPNWNGFNFSLALVDPWGLVNLSGLSLDAGSFSQTGDTYGFEGKLGYEWSGDFSGKIWASFVTQSLDTSSTAFSNQDATGIDIGAKLGFGGFEIVGYYYDGDGLGTTDFLFDAVDLGGNTRDSDGGYFQATYKFGGAGTKIGVSVGESNLDLGPGDGPTGPPTTALVKTNESIVAGIYHPLNDALNLVIEYTATEATAHNGTKAEETSIALGAILFY